MLLAPLSAELRLSSTITPAPNPWLPTSEAIISEMYETRWLSWQIAGMGVLLGVLVVFLLWSLPDFVRFVMLLARPAETKDGDLDKHSHDSAGAFLTPSALGPSAASPKPSFEKLRVETYKEASMPNSPGQAKSWSVASLLLLTSFRFYTGFLSATWLPYLLACEGQYLWAQDQARFMGVAKLIYGLTILLNPLLGLLADRAVTLSYGLGRRIFLRIGITLASIGVFVCIYSGHHKNFYLFLFGITMWRVGEAMNDVTTEALVPELVPQAQFPLGSAVKASMFLVGGIFGYVLLMFTTHVHFSWLYYAYLIGMLTTVIPPLCLLSDDAPSCQAKHKKEGHSFLRYLAEAYTTPPRYKGGFPMACLAVFCYGLGTTPMFFLMLIVRDLVGITDAVNLQYHFSASSIAFFVCAAAAGVMSGRAPNGRQTDEAQSPKEVTTKRAWGVIYAALMSAMIIFAIPSVSLIEGERPRLAVFYVFAALFGAAFGSAFTKFQDVTWALMPADADIGNAMGFNTMSRLFGVGVGNFFAGMMLEYFKADDKSQALDNWKAWIIVHGQAHSPSLSGGAQYTPMGYVVMCWASAACILASAYFARRGLANVDTESVHGNEIARGG